MPWIWEKHRELGSPPALGTASITSPPPAGKTRGRLGSQNTAAEVAEPCPVCRAPSHPGWRRPGQRVGGLAGKGALRRGLQCRKDPPSWLSRGDYSVVSNTAIWENKLSPAPLRADKARGRAGSVGAAGAGAGHVGRAAEGSGSHCCGCTSRELSEAQRFVQGLGALLRASLTHPDTAAQTESLKAAVPHPPMQSSQHLLLALK